MLRVERLSPIVLPRGEAEETASGSFHTLQSDQCSGEDSSGSDSCDLCDLLQQLRDRLVATGQWESRSTIAQRGRRDRTESSRIFDS